MREPGDAEVGHADTLASPARVITPAPLGAAGAPRAAAEFAVVDREQYEVDAELARGGISGMSFPAPSGGGSLPSSVPLNVGPP